MLSQLPCKILVGPLGPNLALADGSRISSSLTHKLCLGSYIGHEDLRAFYMHPALLQPGQKLQTQPKERLYFGGPAGWTLAELWQRLEDWEPQLLIWWGFHYALPVDIADAPCPTMLIVSDWHYHYTAVRQYLKAFDLVLCDKLLLSSLQAQGHRNAFYWPSYAYDPGMMRQQSDTSRDIDICFLGNTNPATYPERNRLLQQLASLGQRYKILIRHNVPHPDYAALLGRSKIVFNHSLRREMNLRAYESAACGALLFQEDDNLEISDFLPTAGPEQACVTYNASNLLEKLSYYLEHEAERQAIAGRGQALIQNFTYEKQFENLLARLPDFLAEVGRPRIRLSGLEQRLLEAAQLVSTAVPALRGRAVELLEQMPRDLIAREILPDKSLAQKWLNALAVCRTDYQSLLETEPGGYQPQTSMSELRTRLVELGGTDAASLSNRAWISFFLQDWPSLQTDLIELGASLNAGPAEISLNPDSFYLPLRFTPLYILRQQLRQALEDDHELLQQEWLRLLRWSWLYLQGYSLLAQQNLPKACEAFAGASQLAPELAESWLELGRGFQTLNQPAAAIAAFENGLGQGVYFPAVWPLLIELLLQTGQAVKARGYLVQALVLFQDPRYAGLQQRLLELRQRLMM